MPLLERINPPFLIKSFPLNIDTVVEDSLLGIQLGLWTSYEHGSPRVQGENFRARHYHVDSAQKQWVNTVLATVTLRTKEIEAKGIWSLSQGVPNSMTSFVCAGGTDLGIVSQMGHIRGHLKIPQYVPLATAQYYKALDFTPIALVLTLMPLLHWKCKCSHHLLQTLCLFYLLYSLNTNSA